MQILEHDGKPAFVVLPIDEYQALQKQLEELQDIKDARIIKENEEAFPAEVANRLLDGENPIKVFREYRKVKQNELAQAVGVAAPFLSRMEKGNATGKPDTLKKIADYLNVDLEDLINL